MGTRYGYHASHQQFTPRDLLTWMRHAEQAGFVGAMCSDGFFPWLPEQSDGVASAYSWLGAALQATGFPVGVVSAPGQRYHPAILAQAAATLWRGETVNYEGQIKVRNACLFGKMRCGPPLLGAAITQ